jgi:hypothetical protein
MIERRKGPTWAPSPLSRLPSHGKKPHRCMDRTCRATPWRRFANVWAGAQGTAPQPLDGGALTLGRARGPTRGLWPRTTSRISLAHVGIEKNGGDARKKRRKGGWTRSSASLPHPRRRSPWPLLLLLSAAAVKEIGRESND